MIPLATTTITVKRIANLDTTDPWEATASPETVVAGVPAHIGRPSGLERLNGGSQEDIGYRLGCNVVELDHTCTVVDDQTGSTYTVEWVQERRGLGLDHLEAGLRKIAGAV